MPREEQWLLEEKHNGIKNQDFYADCKRLALGEPLGYLIGSVPFLGCKIWLDSKPLIPRVETEFWTERAITEIEKLPNPRVLDLCAGSGCIGIAVARVIKDSQVDFSEIDQSHLTTLAKNLSENNINSKRSTIYHANLFSDINETYNFILSNPPYIDPAVDRAEDSVKHHEPFIALYGGEGGLEIIKNIISGAAQHLKPAGQLWIEHEPEQSTAIQRLAVEAGFIATTHLDQYRVERYSILMLQ